MCGNYVEIKDIYRAEVVETGRPFYDLPCGTRFFKSQYHSVNSGLLFHLSARSSGNNSKGAEFLSAYARDCEKVDGSDFVF